MGRSNHCALVLLVMFMTEACSSSVQPTPQPTNPGESSSGPNALTDAERAAGWQLLFDGRSTSGWRGYRQATIPTGWQAIDGALTRVAGSGDIITTSEFSNFELALEWQIADGGNSGIMYRVSESADATFLSGPEYQVLDNARHPDGRTALSSAGSCYAMYAPVLDVTRPAGSWNDVRIVAQGAHVEHWLNGVKVVEYELGSADWLARLQASVFRDVPTYGRSLRGHIALQDHGDPVAYRAVKLRPLP